MLAMGPAAAQRKKSCRLRLPPPPSAKQWWLAEWPAADILNRKAKELVNTCGEKRRARSNAPGAQS